MSDHGKPVDVRERGPSENWDEGAAFRDRCGVFGVFGNPEASKLTYLGIHALQHRGQESAGIVAASNGQILGHRGMGLVADVFSAETLDRLKGEAAIGHVRYSTAGESQLKNAQPFMVDYSGGALAVAHNGNLVNARKLRRDLETQGSIFQSTMDTEVLMHLIARSRAGSLEERVEEALRQVEGAYSLLFLSREVLIGARDPLGFRPLVLGRVGGTYVLASETCALDLIEAELIREVQPGEIVVIDRGGLRSIRPDHLRATRKGHCIFELVYFSRPDSMIFGRSVWQARKAMGRSLAREHPVEADLVIPVPDSGVPAAIGYSEESGVPFDLGLVRSHYVGRTFIEPAQSIRNFGVKLKLSPVRAALAGKRVVVVDDSVVRGTTSRKIVAMLRNAGAREVHLRIASPPTTDPCYFGIDTPTKQELIAASHSVEEIARYVTADTLGYLSQQGLHEAAQDSGEMYCDGCFTGNYLIDHEEPESGGERLRLVREGREA
ncbi:MAG: amidophosphoribosyltransferase [Deltaproteobacteria bacterium]|nr:amidophosphoribosyltransferase [Deltaproteobacteria bacterium]